MKPIPREFFQALDDLDRRHQEARKAYFEGVESYRQRLIDKEQLHRLFETERLTWNAAQDYFHAHFSLDQLDG